jgi:hypothetical protein
MGFTDSRTSGGPIDVESMHPSVSQFSAMDENQWSWLIFVVIAFIAGLFLAEPLGFNAAFWDGLRRA